MADVIQNSIFDSLVPFITGMNLGSPATIECYLPPDFIYDSESMQKYFNKATINVDYTEPVYYGSTKVRDFTALGHRFHAEFKDHSIAEYLAIKRFGV